LSFPILSSLLGYGPAAGGSRPEVEDAGWTAASISYRQVLHDFDEQLVQPAEDCLRRDWPPPIPKLEVCLTIRALPQDRQVTVFSPPRRTRASKLQPQSSQTNS
jgi:hypothetical protein